MQAQLLLVVAWGAGLMTPDSAHPGVLPRDRDAFAVAVDAEERLLYLLQKKGTFRDPTIPYAITAKAVRGKRLINPVLSGQSNAGGRFVLRAREATVRVDSARGTLLLEVRKGEAVGEDGTIATFESRTFALPFPKSGTPD